MLTHIDKIIAKHRPYMLKVASKYRNIKEPEDLVQDTCIRLWRFLDNIGSSTAIALSDNDFQKISSTFIKNVATTKLTNQEKFEKENMIHESFPDITTIEDLDDTFDITPQYLEFMRSNLDGKSLYTFNLIINVYNGKVFLTRKDICSILDIDYPTLFYHLRKIKNLSNSFSNFS